MSNPNPPAPADRPSAQTLPPSASVAVNPLVPSPAPRWFLGLCALALVAYAIFLAKHTTVAAGGSDSSGYLNSARLFAAGQLETLTRVPPEITATPGLFRPHFQPWGFIATAEHERMVPSYPMGLPLHFALAAKLLGWTAGPLAIAVGAALAAVMLCYLVGRELGLDRTVAVAGAVILGVCPVLFFASIQPLSDTLATAWCLAAVYAGLRARQRTAWALACGAAVGVAVLVRPTNIVILPALLVLLGFDFRRLGLAVAGGLPIAAWQAFYNHTLYGGAFRSGYPAIESAFAASYVAPTALHFLRWSAVFVPAIMLLLPLAAVARRETRTRHLLALALWFGAITTVYLFYAISHEDWSCLRFVLPALPALILAGLLGLETLSRLLPSHWPVCVRATAGIVLIVWTLGGSWYWTRKQGILYIKGYEEAYAEANAAAKKTFPPDALVVTSLLSGALYFYTDFPILRFDLVSAEDFARYSGAAQKAGRPICALIHETEEAGLREHCPGNWTKLATSRSVTLWRLADAAPPVAK